MKLNRVACVLLTGTFFNISVFAQTNNAIVPIQPVANKVVSSPEINNTASSRVKVIEKKKRKPCQVRCVKKTEEITNKVKK
jgi:hypothetical protein